MADNDLSCEVLVAGAGPAGLATAGLLAQGGVPTILCGPAAGAGDTRTAALFSGAQGCLDRLGAGAELAGKGEPLRGLRIIDRLEREDHPSMLYFPASEIGLEAFGTNFRNADLVAALEQVSGKAPALTRLHALITNFEHRDDGIIATLSDGRRLKARAVAACDGRNSPARQAAGISSSNWDYGQTALAFQVSHHKSHQDICIEVHRPGGPLTFIPLPGRRSAVNWLVRPGEARRLGDLSDEAFLDALKRACGGVLGGFSDVGTRAIFPITGLSVDTLAKNRTALIGEAAHVLPPIGAQGLNLGFRDAWVFADLAIRACQEGRDPGSEVLLKSFRAARKSDVLTRRTATDLLNRTLLLDSGAMTHLRGLGLVLLASSAAARAKLMSQGMGA